jgi:hypothetical protein
MLTAGYRCLLVVVKGTVDLQEHKLRAQLAYREEASRSNPAIRPMTQDDLDRLAIRTLKQDPFHYIGNEAIVDWSAINPVVNELAKEGFDFIAIDTGALIGHCNFHSPTLFALADLGLRLAKETDAGVLFVHRNCRRPNAEDIDDLLPLMGPSRAVYGLVNSAPKHRAALKKRYPSAFTEHDEMTKCITEYCIKDNYDRGDGVTHATIVGQEVPCRGGTDVFGLLVRFSDMPKG